MELIYKLFCICIIVIALSGCASHKVNLVDEGVVSIERLPSKGVYISRAYAYKEGVDLVVSGRVKRSRSVASPSGGHVDIAILSSDRKIIKTTSTSYTPRIIRRKGARESFFTARIPMVPPAGAVVAVVYHRPSYSTDRTFDCKNNAAIPTKR